MEFTSKVYLDRKRFRIAHFQIGHSGNRTQNHTNIPKQLAAEVVNVSDYFYVLNKNKLTLADIKVLFLQPTENTASNILYADCTLH